MLGYITGEFFLVTAATCLMPNTIILYQNLASHCTLFGSKVISIGHSSTVNKVVSLFHFRDSFLPSFTRFLYSQHDMSVFRVQIWPLVCIAY